MKRNASIETTGAAVAKKIGAVITPEQLAANGSEHGNQAAIFQWIVLHGQKDIPFDLLFAVPNGGSRTASVAASLKAEGVKSGVPDLYWPVPRGVYPGLWIEMKKPGEQKKIYGGRSVNQAKWHRSLRRQGYAVCTCYNWQAAVDVLRLYWNGALEMPDDGDCLFVE